MNVVFLGSRTLWYEYYREILPPDSQLHQATGLPALSGLAGDATILIDDLTLISGPEDFTRLTSHAHSVIIIRNQSRGDEELPDWLEHAAGENTAALWIDSGTTSRSESPIAQHFMDAGVPVSNPKPEHDLGPDQPIRVGLVVDEGQTIDLGHAQESRLTFKQIPITSSTSLRSLITELRSCQIVVQNIQPGRRPGLASWLALAQGCTVLSNLSSTRSQASSRAEQLLPLVDSREDSLMGTLDSLVRDPRTLRDLARRGVDFIQNYRRIELTRVQMAKLLKR